MVNVYVGSRYVLNFLLLRTDDVLLEVGTRGEGHIVDVGTETENIQTLIGSMISMISMIIILDVIVDVMGVTAIATAMRMMAMTAITEVGVVEEVATKEVEVTVTKVVTTSGVVEEGVIIVVEEEVTIEGVTIVVVEGTTIRGIITEGVDGVITEGVDGITTEEVEEITAEEITIEEVTTVEGGGISAVVVEMTMEEEVVVGGTTEEGEAITGVVGTIEEITEGRITMKATDTEVGEVVVVGMCVVGEEGVVGTRTIIMTMKVRTTMRNTPKRKDDLVTSTVSMIMMKERKITRVMNTTRSIIQRGRVGPRTSTASRSTTVTKRRVTVEVEGPIVTAAGTIMRMMDIVRNLLIASRSPDGAATANPPKFPGHDQGHQTAGTLILV
jgi:hypothetical protein